LTYNITNNITQNISYNYTYNITQNLTYNITNNITSNDGTGGWTNNTQNTTTLLNVGIGTTAPGYTLDVEGDIHTHNLYFNSSGQIKNYQNDVMIMFTDEVQINKPVSILGNISMPTAFFIGSSASATADKAVAIGPNAVASNQSSLAIGDQAQSSSLYGIALGYQASASGSYSYALGMQANSAGLNSVAVGYASTSAGYLGVAIGNGADSLGQQAVAVGGDTYSDHYALAVGTGSNATGYYAQAMGYDTTTAADYAIAIGYNTSATHTSSVALGKNAATTATNQLAIGSASSSLNTRIFGRLNVTSGNDICIEGGNCLSTAGGTDGTGGWTNNTQNTTTNYNVGIGTTSPRTALEVNGAIRLSGTSMDTFTTPAGSDVLTKINIPPFDPGSNGQIIIAGLNASATNTSRAFVFVDARTVSHQPTLGVFSPDEASILGLSWDGSQTIAKLKAHSALGTYPDLAFSSSNNTDMTGRTTMMLKGTGLVGIGTENPTQKLDVNGSITTNGNLTVTTGYVGIGTQIPTQTLDVNGSINISSTDGCIYLPGGGRLCGNSTCATMYSPNGNTTMQACN
jgi:hypothetical protein